MKTSIRRVAQSVMIATLLVTCASGIYAHRLRRRADDMLGAAYELSLRRDPPTIQDIRQRFGTALKQQHPCTSDGCGYEVSISNQVLATTRLVPYSALTSYFWVRDGVVDHHRLEFWTMAKPDWMVLAYVAVRYCDRCDTLTISPSEDSHQWSTTGSVEVGYRSSVGNRRIAFALNTPCLTGFRACGNIAEIFPTLWRETTDGTIICRIPNHDGTIEDLTPSR